MTDTQSESGKCTDGTEQSSFLRFDPPDANPMDVLPGWHHLVVWGHDHVSRIMPVDPADCHSCEDKIGSETGCTNHMMCGMDDAPRAFRRIGPLDRRALATATVGGGSDAN